MPRNARRSAPKTSHPPCFAAETMESRLPAGAMLAAAAAGVELNLPTLGGEDTQLESAAVLAGLSPAAVDPLGRAPAPRPLPPPSHLPPLLPLLPAEADPMSPVGDPPRAAAPSVTAAALDPTKLDPRRRKGEPPPVTTLSDTPNIYVSVEAIQPATEGSPSPGSFRFWATYGSCCGSEPPVPAVTVNYSLAGDARPKLPNVPDPDYEGSILQQTVSVPVNGSTSVPFYAIDDKRLELSFESLIAQVESGDYYVPDPS